MERATDLKITREKHLDHMVKVVPFIVFCYGVHSYILLSLGSGQFSIKGIMFLGGLLALLITALVLYDIKHQVVLDQEMMRISFLGYEQEVSYQSILKVEVISPQETFSTLKVTTKSGKLRFFFIDDADKVKCWIEGRQFKEEEKKAA